MYLIARAAKKTEAEPAKATMGIPTLENIMQHDAYTVSASVPVLSDGVLVGTISRTDITRVLMNAFMEKGKARTE